MAEKVKVSREVAKAIEELRSRGYQNAEIIANWWMEQDDGLGGVINANIFDGDILLTALVTGYEIEKTPEEKWSERYRQIIKPLTFPIADDVRDLLEKEKRTIEEMARDFGLKIEGVNA